MSLKLIRISRPLVKESFHATKEMDKQRERRLDISERKWLHDKRRKMPGPVVVLICRLNIQHVERMAKHGANGKAIPGPATHNHRSIRGQRSSSENKQRRLTRRVSCISSRPAISLVDWRVGRWRGVRAEVHSMFIILISFSGKENRSRRQARRQSCYHHISVGASCPRNRS